MLRYNNRKKGSSVGHAEIKEHPLFQNSASLHQTITCVNTVCRKAKKIIKDIKHPSHCLFTPLSSRRQGQYSCIKAGARETEKQLLSQGHQTAKQPSLTQRGCCLL
jgi:hypothetical protein